jgi:hypothetical protein
MRRAAVSTHDDAFEHNCSPPMRFFNQSIGKKTEGWRDDSFLSVRGVRARFTRAVLIRTAEQCNKVSYV